jgi:7-cyano-7-deazaguanine reductase
MDLKARRALLATLAGPGSRRLDYVVSLNGRVAHAAYAAPLAIVLRYVPDKWTLDPASFARYLAALAGADLASIEAVGVAILEDVNNEVVPRWIQVAATTGGGGGEAAEGLGVLVEDRQPKWDNPALLSRLRAF